MTKKAVPGSRDALYSVGRRMIASYPQVPAGYDLGINCAVTSYCGKLCVGLSAGGPGRGPSTGFYAIRIRRPVRLFTGRARTWAGEHTKGQAVAGTSSFQKPYRLIRALSPPDSVHGFTTRAKRSISAPPGQRSVWQNFEERFLAFQHVLVVVDTR